MIILDPLYKKCKKYSTRLIVSWFWWYYLDQQKVRISKK